MNGKIFKWDQWFLFSLFIRKVIFIYNILVWRIYIYIVYPKNCIYYNVTVIIIIIININMYVYVICIYIFEKKWKYNAIKMNQMQCPVSALSYRFSIHYAHFHSFFSLIFKCIFWLWYRYYFNYDIVYVYIIYL